MRLSLLVIAFTSFFAFQLQAQRVIPADEIEYEPDDWLNEGLNTARNATYMLPEEREMIYEVNRLRSDPQRYIKYLVPYLKEARRTLEIRGKGEMHYSLTTIYSTDARGVETVTVDTTWHDRYQEEVDAVEDLIATLEKLEPLSILKPDRGIYRAAQAHAKDERAHEWKLGHRGSDGSWPNERITTHATNMKTGNENIAGKGMGYQEHKPSPRAVVIQLLIDSGIPGYGHRDNILNPAWTHFAPCYGGWARRMHWWLQEFGAEKTSN